MSFDGNGNYTVPAGTAATTGTVIDSTLYNALLTDLQTALTKAFLRDGQSAALANLPMGGYKLTGLAAGSSANDSVRFDQLAAGNIVNTPAGSIVATTVQAAINELATEKIAAGLVTASGLTMSTARVLGRTTASTGAIEELTAAQVSAFAAVASDTAQGVVELATIAETQAGTDATRAVTPDGLNDTVLGMGQTYQDMTASRAMATLYTNSTGRPIIVDVRCNNSSQCNYTLSIAGNAVSLIKHLASDTVTQCAYGIVPNGATYQITLSAGTALGIAWWELR